MRQSRTIAFILALGLVVDPGLARAFQTCHTPIQNSRINADLGAPLFRRQAFQEALAWMLESYHPRLGSWLRRGAEVKTPEREPNGVQRFIRDVVDRLGRAAFGRESISRPWRLKTFLVIGPLLFGAGVIYINAMATLRLGPHYDFLRFILFALSVFGINLAAGFFGAAVHAKAFSQVDASFWRTVWQFVRARQWIDTVQFFLRDPIHLIAFWPLKLLAELAAGYLLYGQFFHRYHESLSQRDYAKTWHQQFRRGFQYKMSFMMPWLAIMHGTVEKHHLHLLSPILAMSGLFLANIILALLFEKPETAEPLVSSLSDSLAMPPRLSLRSRLLKIQPLPYFQSPEFEAFQAAVGDCMRKIDLPDWGKITFAAFGNPGAPPILLYHGFPGGRGDGAVLWEMAKAAGVQLIIPDRQHYDPKKERRPDLEPAVFTAEAWADATGDLMTALGFEKFGLLGYSAGGHLAEHALRKMAHRLTSVALVAPRGAIHSAALREPYSPMLRRLFTIAAQSPPVRALLTVRFFRTMAVNFQWGLNFVASGLSPFEQRQLKDSEFLQKFFRFSWDYGLLGLSEEAVWETLVSGARIADVSIAEPAVPMYLVSGDEDYVVPRSVVHGFIDRNPGIEAYFLREAGHISVLIHLEPLFRRMGEHALGETSHGRIDFGSPPRTPAEHLEPPAEALKAA